jgi:hypothetical protein
MQFLIVGFSAVKPGIAEKVRRTFAARDTFWFHSCDKLNDCASPECICRARFQSLKVTK